MKCSTSMNSSDREQKEKGKIILKVEGRQGVTAEQSLRTQISLTFQMSLITVRVKFATDIIQKREQCRSGE